MVDFAFDALLGWLALPIPQELLEHDIERLQTTAASAGSAEPFVRRLIAATTETDAPRPPGIPSNDLERALDLLARGERAAVETDREAWRLHQEGQRMVPSAAVLSSAGSLHALARTSQELRAAGVAGAIAAHATAWLFAHNSDPLSPPAQAVLRDAVAGLFAQMPRRGLAQAFSALARACTHQGRADLWQAQVQNLMDTHPDSVPYDLAWWVALRSVPVIAGDSRWFRAAKTRTQAEQLLDLRHDPDDPGQHDRLDAVRVELAEAYVMNRDLDEEPWTVTLDKVVHDLIGRLGAFGIDLVLDRFTMLVMRSYASAAEQVRGLMQGWVTTDLARLSRAWKDCHYAQAIPQRVPRRCRLRCPEQG